MRMNARLRFTLTGLSVAAAVGFMAPNAADAAGGTMRVGIDASDVPTASGQASHGGTGFRWMGWTIFDSLVYFDEPEKGIPMEIPHLAQKFYVRPEDNTKWVFELRRDVKFHDGTEFNADAVIWNIEKLYKKDAPQYDAAQVSNTACCLLDINGWRKVDNFTVEMSTPTPNAMIVYRLPWLWIVSPTAWQKAGSWAAFEKKPVGSGPFRLEEIVPRERAVLVRNESYWDKSRVTSLEKLIVMPIADGNTRAAALLSGQVDFIENPPPDTLPRIQSAGKQIIKNKYPHIWPYILRVTGKDTPLKDVRVRQAI
ncbi:MAG: ABC transporter substrate-binding protein, partial [Rhodospirillales bacterium]|nr:ABC transporter substrate-binding protein [Rhodospirillales bacterium]